MIFGALPLKLLSYPKNEKITFDYGVASGDPTNSHIILWTKVSKKNRNDIYIKQKVSNDINFEKLIASGSHISSFSDNFTVKVDAEIPQEFNGKKVYYRFNYENIYSDIGTTSTLPSDNPNKYNIAFCSCSNYPAGFFNAYKDH